MKKAMSIILALVNVQTLRKSVAIVLSAVLLSVALVPLTSLAYGNERIQLNKDNFDPNETMKITIKGVTQQMVDDWACIGIFTKDLSRNALDGYGELHQVGDNVFDGFEAPAEPGEYVVVLFSKWWQNGSFNELFLSSLPFTVGKVAQVGSISLDKTAYTALNPITVSYSGITQQMINAKAFVRIHGKGANQSSYGALPLTQSSGTITINAPNQNGEFEMRLYSVDDGNWNATTEHLVMSVPFTLSGAMGSGWAQGDIEQANAMGLIPDSLRGQDLTRPITRAEFAAVAVLLYENLTGKKTTPSPVSTFTDTRDDFVLRAHKTDLMKGISNTQFAPNRTLTRQEAATALTRVLKAAYIPGWTFDTDGQYTLNYTRPAPFADDARISSWAKESVYFMAANKVIEGVGNNNFAPRAVTTAEQATGYATSTRQQALVMAVRMVNNLKDKPLNYT